MALRLAELITARGRTWASDSDVYDLVDAASREVITLLQNPSFALPVADLPPDGAGLVGLRDFARLVVAGWVDYSHHSVDATLCSTRTQPPVRQANAMFLVRATELLLAQQRAGYCEAIHHLYFPRGSHATGLRYETHPALLSHRAVTLDSLLDARAAGLPVPRAVLDSEAMAILRAKHREVRGGWNYIPEVPELPPDADDVGQVLQVLYRLGGPNLASTCDEAVRLAIDATTPDGGILTWILDPRGRSLADLQILDYLSVMGGWGVHPEVMANLLYGMILYDPDRYHEALVRSAAYLESVQEDDGSWTSKWYAGPYYGTYRALAVLNFLTPQSGALKRAQTFLTRSQHDDGSWGVDAGEPLSTALAMLGMAILDSEATAMPSGQRYLLTTQSADGGWAACPWIYFPTTDGIEIYSSRTITTAFCLKALVAVGSAS